MSDTLRRPKSSFEIECTELEHTPTSAVGFFNGAATVLHKKSPHLVNHLVISASWRPSGTCVAFHRRAAIFDPVAPLVNLCNVHGIVAESLLNLSNCFHLSVTKFEQNLKQYIYSSRSITLGKERKNDEDWLQLLTWKLTASDSFSAGLIKFSHLH